MSTHPETIDLGDPRDAWAFKVAMAAYAVAAVDPHVQAAGYDILAQTGERQGQWGLSESALYDGIATAAQKQNVSGYWQPNMEGACDLLLDTNTAVGWGSVDYGVRTVLRHYFDAWTNGPVVSCYQHRPHGTVVPATNVLVLTDPSAGGSGGSSSKGSTPWLLALALGIGGVVWYRYKR